MNNLIYIAKWLRSLTVSVLHLWRSWWLAAVTLGAWDRLGSFALDLSEDLDQMREDIDRLTYRLDETHRLMDGSGIFVIPSTIEPPRLTAHGSGLSIEDEAEQIKKAMETERLEAPARAEEVRQARVHRIAVLHGQIERAVATSQEAVGIDLARARQELEGLEAVERGIPSEVLEKIAESLRERRKVVVATLEADLDKKAGTPNERVAYHMLERELRQIDKQLVDAPA